MAEVVKEEIRVDAPDAELVRVSHVRLLVNGLDMGGLLYFARANLAWFIGQLESLLTIHAFPEVEEQRGDDLLVLYEGGHEQAPIVNLQNERREDAPQGGIYALTLSKDTAATLLDALKAL